MIGFNHDGIPPILPNGKYGERRRKDKCGSITTPNPRWTTASKIIANMLKYLNMLYVNIKKLVNFVSQKIAQ